MLYINIFPDISVINSLRFYVLHNFSFLFVDNLN